MADPCFEKVAILGVGLIGGSLGLAVRERGLATRVAAYSRTPATRDRAVALGAADEAAASPAACVDGADLVYLSMPVGAIVPSLADVAPYLRPGCLVTDAGSTKREIVEAVGRLDLGAACFVGGHPMTGSECVGVEHARADLFDQMTYVFTPGPATEPATVERLVRLARGLGARVVCLDAAEHDEAVAVISHLPHVLAWALMAVTRERHEAGQPVLDLAAGSWCSATRVAAADPLLWRDILTTNRAAVVAAIGDFQAALSELRELVEGGCENSILAALDPLAQAKRRHSERT